MLSMCLKNDVLFVFSPLCLIDAGIQVVVPSSIRPAVPLTTLLACPWLKIVVMLHLVRNDCPLFVAVLLHQLDDGLILLPSYSIR